MLTITIQELDEMLRKLRPQICEVIKKTEFEDCNNLFTLKDSEKITNPDEFQLIEEYTDALSHLCKTHQILDYLHCPVDEESTLFLNSQGNFECSFHTFHCGDRIEFYLYDVDYESYKWCTSRVEHDGEKYYIVGHRNVDMNGLRVRNRKR